MRSKSKKIYILFVIIALLCVSIGYAVLNSTLIINGKSNISKNTWDVHFENIKITDGSVTASVVPTISNNTTISNFELTLDKPGDFYEFTVDVKNTGTIDAMIDSVVKTPDLTNEQKKYINYVISYQNGQEITIKNLVKSNDYVRINVRVEYKKDLTASDLPSVTETLTLGLDINYIQADETGVEVFGRGITYVDGDINEIGTVVTIGTEKFYTIGTEAGNVKLLSMYNLHVGNKYNVSDDIVTPLDKPKGIQDPSAIGYFRGNSATNPLIGTMTFSNSTYWIDITTFPTTVYNEESNLYNYVENYKNYLIDFGVEINKARLITYEELESLGCKLSSNTCTSAPSWLYLTTFWTSSAGANDKVWNVISNGYAYADLYNCNRRGIRPVIEVSLEELGIKKFSPVADGDINEIGTVVTIGTEKFYTIGSEGDNVKLLSMYNLYVGNQTVGMENGSPVMGELTNLTGMQRYNARGSLINNFDDDGLDLTFPFIGVTPFSTYEKHGINYSDYNGSVIEEYVNDYKIKMLDMFNVKIFDARLITKEELINPYTLACDINNKSCITSTYPWIYSTTYWTESIYDEETLWFVNTLGLLQTYSATNGDGLGVRPVIVISKEYF